MPRTQSTINRERYYSLADTKKDLPKIVNQRKQKRKATVERKNETMKKYIQSKRNVLAGVEDDEKEQDGDGDVAMVVKDKEFSKVDEDGDTQLAQTPLSPPPKATNTADTEMKDAGKDSSSSSSTQTSTAKEPEKKATVGSDSALNAKSQSTSGAMSPVKTPTANPSVNIASFGSEDKTNSKDGHQSRKSGIFKGLFKKKSVDPAQAQHGVHEIDGDGQVEEPKRLKYQLPNSKGEKFELYTWLKPTKLLGEGAYAAVCEVVDERTKKKYAIKKNRDVFSNVADARRILREIKLMIHLDHPHVMGLLGVIPPEPHDRDTYKDCYLIMPKMDTTLSKVIRSKQKLSERHIQYFVYQIARGLEYMHSGGIIHRDLKPENILVNAADCKVKITDFGLARGVRVDVDSPQKLTEYVVTRWYRAPEVMCCSRLYDYQIDTWSLGCISAELYTRRPLFKGRNHIEQLQLIFHFMGTPQDLTWITTPDAKKWISGMDYKAPQDLSKVLPNSSKAAQSFVAELLRINPHKRPDVATAIKHEWLKEFARDKDYRKCPVFNISFEYEASIKTAFGVRHMMYEELHAFHRKCLKKEQQRMQKYQAYKQQQKKEQQPQIGRAHV